MTDNTKTPFFLSKTSEIRVLSKANWSEKNWMSLGKCGAAHGIKGEIKLYLKNPDSDSIRPESIVGLKPVFSSDLVVFKVLTVKDQNRVKLEDVDTRNEAEELRNAEVWVERTSLPPLKDDEIYLADLLEAKAVDTKGALLGSISGFSDNGPQILAHVLTTDNKEMIIPFVKPILKSIDEVKRVVVFDPPEGL